MIFKVAVLQKRSENRAYKKIKTIIKYMAESGQIKTAVKASNGRWYIDAAEEPEF